MRIPEFLNLLSNVKPNGKRHMASCPAHDDKVRSFCVEEGRKGDRIVCHCQKGCSKESVYTSLGIVASDLYYEPMRKAVKDKKDTWRWIWEDNCTPISMAWAKDWLMDRRGWPAEMAEAVAPILAGVGRENQHVGERKLAIPRFDKNGDQCGVQVFKKKMPGEEKGADKRHHGEVSPGNGPATLAVGLCEKEIVVFVESLANGLAVVAAGARAIVAFSLSTVKGALKNQVKALKKKGCKVYLCLDQGVPEAKEQERLCKKHNIKGLWFREDNKPGFDIDEMLLDCNGLETFKDVVKDKIAGASADCPWPLPGAPDVKGADSKDVKKGGSAALPIIYVRGGELPGMVDQAEAALLAKYPHEIFQRGGILARINQDAKMPKGIKRDHGSASIGLVEKPLLIDYFTRVADWERYDSRSDSYKPVNCPGLIAEVFAVRKNWRLNVLTEIIESPTLRPDGSILDKPGYDDDTGFMYINNLQTNFPKIPENPTLTEAKNAIDKIKNLLKDFDFVSKEDCAVAIAAILTCLVRRSLRTAPLICFSAPKMGSGKTLLTDVVALIATGKNSTKISQPPTLEEEKKQLHALLLAGTPTVCIDNIDAPLGSAPLCSIISGTEWTCRILGVTENATVNPTVTMMATGNNLVLRGDITTRAIICTLDPKCERPEEREFKGDIRETVKKERGELVVAGLTLLRAYHVAGRPEQKVPVMGRFEDWSYFVRNALIWAGEADPCKSRKEIEKNDPEREKLISILTAWHDCFGERPLTATKELREAVCTWTDIDQKERLEDALMAIVVDKSGKIDYKKIGYYFRANKNRIENGYRLEMMTKKSNRGFPWRVVWVFLHDRVEQVKKLVSDSVLEAEIDKVIGTDKLETEEHRKFWNAMTKIIG